MDEMDKKMERKHPLKRSSLPLASNLWLASTHFQDVTSVWFYNFCGPLNLRN